MSSHSRASALEQDPFEEIPSVQPRLAEFADTWTYLLSLRDIGTHRFTLLFGFISFISSRDFGLQSVFPWEENTL